MPVPHFSMRLVIALLHSDDDDDLAIQIHVVHRGVDDQIGVAGDALHHSLFSLGPDLHAQDRAVVSDAEDHMTAVGVGHGRH